MKEELILRILDKASEFLDHDHLQKLRNIIDTKIYDYDVQPTEKSLVPVSKAPEMLKLNIASKKIRFAHDFKTHLNTIVVSAE